MIKFLGYLMLGVQILIAKTLLGYYAFVINLFILTVNMMKYLLSATLILLSTLSYAEEVPNTFSSGDTISSSKINANFSFLADAMARGNITAMMWCSGGFVFVSESDPNFVTDSNWSIIPDPILALTDCSSSDGMYNGFVETTYCRGSFNLDSLTTSYKKCEFQLLIYSKKFAITIKELIIVKTIGSRTHSD